MGEGPAYYESAILGLVSCPGFSKEAVWARREEQAESSTLPGLLHQLLFPGPCPAWVPVLIFFDDELYVEVWPTSGLSSASVFGPSVLS